MFTYIIMLNKLRKRFLVMKMKMKVIIVNIYDKEVCDDKT